MKTGFILGYFGSRDKDAQDKYRAFVEGLIGKEYESPLRATICSSLLGRAGFVEEITAAHVTTKEADRNIPALRQLIIRPLPEEIITGVKAIFSGNERLARQASIYLCHKYSGAKLREIGRLFDMRETAISEASRRFSLKMGNDEKVLNLVRMVEGMLKI